ncbi:MAG: response regulator [Cyanobacteria bacterium J06588_4]
MVVDDNRDNLLFASYIIESMNMSYVVTDKGERCLEIIQELMPDIILLDIVMPKIDGITLAKTIKQNQTLAQIPIIAVTGLTKLHDREKLIAAKFDDYLCKPYLIEELETKLRRLLGHSSS